MRSPQAQGQTSEKVMQQTSPNQPQTVFGAQPPMGQQSYVPAGQPVPFVPGPGVPVNQAGGGQIERPYVKSKLSIARFLEIFTLLIAWPCGAVYANRTLGLDGRATAFVGIATFCWVMVIIMQIVFLVGINKDQRYFRTPSTSTLIVLTVQVLMTILLLAGTTSLTMRGVDLYKANIAYSDRYGESKPFDVNNLLLIGAVVFGALACFFFMEDIPQLTKMYRLQRAKEIAAADNTQ